MIPRFRVWSISRRRMFEVTSMEWTFPYFTVTGYPTNRKLRTGISGMSKDMILLQSMGRKDDRDREIFQGDFVRITSAGYDHSLIYIVVKDSISFFLQGTNHSTKKFGDLRITRNMRFRIVGNIHKDKKMLEAYWKQVRKYDIQSR